MVQYHTGEASDEEEELPPSDYADDGTLLTALESFSDIRLIRRATHPPETGALSSSFKYYINHCMFDF